MQVIKNRSWNLDLICHPYDEEEDGDDDDNDDGDDDDNDDGIGYDDDDI